MKNTNFPENHLDLQEARLATSSSDSIYDYDREELAEIFASLDQPAYRVDQLLRGIYSRRATNWEQMTDLPARVREILAERLSPRLPEIVQMTGSKDTTRKFLFRFQDGDFVESVLIPSSPALYGSQSDRRTICLSSQVGCAYGCKFCASGLDGWKRDLSPGEILGQFLAVEAFTEEKINNIVFMGMGEPLANFPALMKSIDLLNSPWGIGLGARHMTISTSGLVPQIYELADQSRQIRLAISLHGATDEVRSQIMPINKKYPLSVLLEACDYYTKQKKQRLSFEYILIAGVNDRAADARALLRIARPLQAKINLIPYNHVEGLPWKRPSEAAQEEFFSILRRGGLAATIRREKGHDIAAACGQLRLTALKKESASF